VVEGIGLIRRQRWAEYLTVVATSLLLPVELYELAHRPTAGKAAVLAANVGVVVYLVVQLRATAPKRADKRM
jgi:uncharacterized membrane protein (DUF2068 family)